MQFFIRSIVLSVLFVIVIAQTRLVPSGPNEFPFRATVINGGNSWGCAILSHKSLLCPAEALAESLTDVSVTVLNAIGVEMEIGPNLVIVLDENTGLAMLQVGVGGAFNSVSASIGHAQSNSVYAFDQGQVTAWDNPLDELFKGIVTILPNILGQIYCGSNYNSNTNICVLTNGITACNTVAVGPITLNNEVVGVCPHSTSCSNALLCVRVSAGSTWISNNIIPDV